jgi:hypothetical protein
MFRRFFFLFLSFNSFKAGPLISCRRSMLVGETSVVQVPQHLSLANQPINFAKETLIAKAKTNKP